ncbi:unnamed protein product, partial [Coregonus sp. 'balchen']
MPSCWRSIYCTMTCKSGYAFLKALLKIRNNARYLWKRIPQAIKTANLELTAVWAVGQRIWQRDFPGIYLAIAAHQWSENILPVMEALRGTVMSVHFSVTNCTHLT